jgi:hypothetical protein
MTRPNQNSRSFAATAIRESRGRGRVNPNTDTGGEFGVAGLFWRHGVQFLLSDGPMPTAGLRILTAQRNSPPGSVLKLDTV